MLREGGEEACDDKTLKGRKETGGASCLPGWPGMLSKGDLSRELKKERQPAQTEVTPHSESQHCPGNRTNCLWPLLGVGAPASRLKAQALPFSGRQAPW